MYLAEAVGSGLARKVAIKILHAEHAARPQVVQRLRDEARMMAMLRHRAIARVDDLVQLDGSWSIVMGDCEDRVGDRLGNCDVSENEISDCASDYAQAFDDTGSDTCDAYWSASDNEACARILDCLNMSTEEPNGPPAPQSSGGTAKLRPDWLTEVSTGIRDSAHVFVPDGAEFHAAVPGRGLIGRFDVDGAHLTLDDDEIRVRAVAFGRVRTSGIRGQWVILPSVPLLGSCVEQMVDPAGDCVQRLAYAGDGITEWWVSRNDGFEQGWTVDAAPDGVGGLSVEVEVWGADVVLPDRAGRSDLWLLGDAGAQWQVTAPEAWDADGKPLDAWFVATTAGFRVVVDDAGARYPVEIDPVYTTISSTLDEGSGDAFGFSVSGAGDVNNDGYDDVIVGAYNYNTLDGAAYIYHGSSSGVSSTASRSLIPGSSNYYFGYSVSGAGDVNGDGYDDVIIGAFAYSSSRGAVYVYHGSSSGIGATAAIAPTGPSSSSNFGYSVSNAGDVNGDGYDDVVVGAPAYSSSTGAAYVYYGSSAGVTTTDATTFAATGTGSNFGSSVSAAGDVNGDSYDDVIVGAYAYSSSAGRAYVYHGSASGASTSAAIYMSGGSAGDRLGYSVSGAGDVNADGYADVIVGAYAASTNFGQAFVYQGGTTGISNTPTRTLTGGGATYYFGTSVSGAGDVDGDGYDDVIIGASGYLLSTGQAYIYLGSSTGVGATVNSTLTGETTSSYFGSSVSAAGDVDNDGGDDVIVGAYGHSSSTGRAYTYRGYSTVDSDGDGYVQTSDCDDTDEDINPAASEIVDDGIDQDCDDVDSCYTDADGDNFGTSVASDGSTLDCATGDGAPNSTDCDDGDNDTYPGAAPNDSATSCMNDDDADDYGDDTVTGTVVAGTDCADSSSGVYPGRADTPGDGVDQDCDLVDSCYTDSDGDNYGTSVVIDGSSLSCSTGSGAAVDTDCNDGDSAINPAASETVDDAVDQDCDTFDSCYRDGDGDNYGTTAIVDGSSLDCTSGTGAPVSTDCDDGNAAISPAATEITGDSIDEDCDGEELCYDDDDDDGYVDEGESTSISSDPDCYDAGEGTASQPRTDCDDGDDEVRPTAQEICNSIDDDCDTLVDNDDPTVDLDTARTWYLDDDGDGFGVTTDSVVSCDQPSGRVAERNDCDDDVAAVNPDATELCDDIDNNCDGEIDEDTARDATAWHPDEDNDGYGDERQSDTKCDAPDGWISETGDCDDTEDDTNPGADEYCNGHDDDCDDDVDEDAAVDAPTWYIDGDGDGHGNAENGQTSCSQPENRVDNADDCNDKSAFHYPGATDDPYDGDDSDCDGNAERQFIRGRSLASCSTGGQTVPGVAALVLALVVLVRRRRTFATIGILASSSAFAAERYDAHGFNLAPDDGDALDLMSTWRPQAHHPWSFGMTVLGEYSAPTVDHYSQNGDDSDRDALRDGFTAVNLGGTFAFAPSVALAVSAPVYPGNNLPWGDLRIAVPLHPVAPVGSASGFGFSIVPYLDAPTGDELNWLGNRGFGGGTTFAAGWQSARWQVTANAGGFYQPLIENENLRGGPHLLAALGGGALVSDTVALRGEVNYRPSLVKGNPADAESPGEAIISARGSYVWGLNWTAGMATAISAGVGASPVRVFVGGGGAIGKEPLADTDNDGITDAVDRCKADPETVNKYKDRDGCPDALGDLVVKVIDEDQHIVPDATVTAGGIVGNSDSTGAAALRGVVPGLVTGTVVHPVYEQAYFDVDPLAEGPNERTVTVRFKLVPVHIKTVDQNGAPVAARVRFEGPTDFGYRFVGDNGLGTFDLRPGEWRMLISTDNGGTERREIVVKPGQTDPVMVNVAFKPAMAVVDSAKREIIIKEAIYFDVGKDSVQLGSTPIVDQVANVLLDHPEILQMEVQGHTDSDGDDARNLSLSQRRVEAVCRMLIQQGVGAGRLVPRGYGESVPIASNSGEEGKALNRRVQFVIIALDPKAAAPVEVK